ncbi:hypothetical protein COTS27_00544 [Spirochaetota bacterium]|nr:hypothetical protein COTS27_00544 [Spirochaetota bacterium]
MLYNKIDKKLLKKRVANEPFARKTCSFYRYYPLEDIASLRDRLYYELNELSVLGRIYLAAEGINAQCSIPLHQYDNFKHLLSRYDILKNVSLQTGLEEIVPSFYKLTIKIRPELVATNLPTHQANPSLASPKLDPLTFHEALTAEKTLAVDIRNHYEHEVGHFDHALRLPADTFSDLLPMLPQKLNDKKDHNLLLYCTGGIRCEKASAYLRHHGFSNVYQLRGGIIAYANAVKNHHIASRFKGKNFVFDERLGEKISSETIAVCHQCSAPCDTHTNCHYEDCHLLFIQCEQCNTYFNGCCSIACKEKSALPIATQRSLRKRPHPKHSALAVHKARAALKKIDRRPLDNPNPSS